MKTHIHKNRRAHNVIILLCIVASLFRTNSVLAQTNSVIGSLGGDVSVTQMGMATYSIPIEVVPGTNGVQPNLSIVYGSSLGRGYLGCNWQLSGLSSITRVPRAKYPDGSLGTVNFDGNDRYALDGAKLMKLSSGAYATTNAQYGTEIENYTRVKLKGTPDTDTQYFEAVTDQGFVIEYGKTSDSKQITTDNKILSWMVNKISDPEGNYMTFTYSQNASRGEIWPIEINYTGNSTANYSTYAKVVFQYTTDTNINTSYIGGEKIRPTKLLSSIKVKYGSALVREYAFNYTTDRTTRLNAVILKDATGAELTTTSIGWGRDGTTISYNTFTNYSDYIVCTGDYNGDNITDLCLYTYSYSPASCSWQIMKGNRDGSFSSTSYSGTLNGVTSLFTVDLDGSGKDGLGYCTYDSNDEKYTFKVIESVSSPGTTINYPKTETSTFYLGDFLGEGGSQLMFRSNPSGNNVTLTLKKKTGPDSWLSVPLSIDKDSKVSVTDFNGNGKSDIHVVNGTVIDIYEYDESSTSFVKILDSATLATASCKDFFGDFNGDGKQDYIRFRYGTWKLKISRGNSYTDDVDLPFATSSNSSGEPMYPIFVVDINGDGRDDVIQPVHNYNTNSTDFIVYYTRGYDNNTYLYDSQSYHHNSISLCGELYYRFADLNCDGKVEMLYTGALGDTPVLVSFKEKREHDLVLSFTNGIGKTSSLEYAYFNSPNMGYLGLNGRRVTYPLVSKLREPNGIGGLTETTYTYGYTIFDYDRRQLMGFGQFNSYCNGTNIMMNYEFNDTYHHLNLEHVLTYYYPRNGQESGYIGDPLYWEGNNNDYHNETLNTLAYKWLPYGRFIPYFTYSSTIDKLQNKQLRKHYWLQSGDGRLSKVTVKHIKYDSQEPLLEDITAYTYQDVTLQNGKTVKKIYSDTTWHKRTGFSQMPYQCAIYDYSGGRLSTIQVSDSEGAIGTTSYGYNNLGFLESETYTPNGMTARTKSYGYSNNYRFLTQETNELGHVRSVTFYPSTGLMNTQTDANGLTTTYIYDALGHLTDVTRPDRTEQHVRYYVNSNSNFSNAVYYTSVTETGQPSVQTYYDVLGRAIHTYVAGRGYDDVVYNELGLVSKSTYVPYSVANTPSQNKTWHTNEYDIYNRIITENDPYADLSFSYYDYHDATMHEYFVTASDHIRNTQQTKWYDAAGRLTKATDAGGTINYNYSYQTEEGKTRDKLIINVGGNTTTITSDIRGNRLKIQDPDAGNVTCTYNKLNQLSTRTDARFNQAVFDYDLLGRTKQVVYSNGLETETIDYIYDNASGSGIGKLASVKKNGSTDCVYVYDDLGRLANCKVYDGNTPYNHLYQYNDLGQLQYFTYPDSYCIENIYNNFGELYQIKNTADNSLIYSADTRNMFRQPLKCRFGNETGVEYTYNNYGMLTGIKNGDVDEGNNINSGGHEGSGSDVSYAIGNQYRQLSYTYNARGFIDSRSDAKVNQSETYVYDNLDRLDTYTVNGTTTVSFGYTATGNILTNPNVGTYSYSGSKPHAVTGIAGNSLCPISTAQCDVTYNLRNKPNSILQNNCRVVLDYNAAGVRKSTAFYQGNTLKKTVKRISDVCEVESALGVNRKLDYIYAEGQLVAVHVKNGTSDSLYYVLTDHLGSWNKVMDEDKNIVQQTHFDPWGNRMSYTSWNTPQLQTSFPFYRGFTGHEHYDFFNIINANARLYDPAIGRFFSPDPFVQAPDFTQNYNRYSYCLNNPVMYSDKNGEFWHIIAGAVIGGGVNLFMNWDNIDNFLEGVSSFTVGAGTGALTAVNPLAGSIIGTATINANNEITKTTGKGDGFKNVDWSNVVLQTGIGAISGAFTYGAGELVNTLKIGGSPLADRIVDAIGIENLNARAFTGNSIKKTIAGGITGFTSGLTNGFFYGNWDLWKHTWRGSAFGLGSSIVGTGITTLGYQLQLKKGRQPYLNSDIIETASHEGEHFVNQLNEYECPTYLNPEDVVTLGTFELPEAIVVANSLTTATVYLYGLYNPYFTPPQSYFYHSQTLYDLLPLLLLK